MQRRRRSHVPRTVKFSGVAAAEERPGSTGSNEHWPTAHPHVTDTQHNPAPAVYSTAHMGKPAGLAADAMSTGLTARQAWPSQPTGLSDCIPMCESSNQESQQAAERLTIEQTACMAQTASDTKQASEQSISAPTVRSMLQSAGDTRHRIQQRPSLSARMERLSRMDLVDKRRGNFSAADQPINSSNNTQQPAQPSIVGSNVLQPSDEDKHTTHRAVERSAALAAAVPLSVQPVRTVDGSNHGALNGEQTIAASRDRIDTANDIPR